MTCDRVLGVDPSFNRTGWALLSATGELLRSGIVRPKGNERPEQLLSIQRQFGMLLRAHRPDAVYLEEPGVWRRRGGSRVETIAVMAMARGVILAACAEVDVVATEVHFRKARQAVTGSTQGSRQEVIDFVQRSGFGIPVRPRGGQDFDIANAVVLAVYGRQDRHQTPTA